MIKIRLLFLEQSVGDSDCLLQLENHVFYFKGKNTDLMKFSFFFPIFFGGGWGWDECFTPDSLLFHSVYQ